MRLVFAEKRDFVDRKQRLEEAARLKREEAVMEKDHYTNEVIKQKREYVELRRQMAIQGIVETRSLFDSATFCIGPSNDAVSPYCSPRSRRRLRVLRAPLGVSRRRAGGATPMAWALARMRGRFAFRALDWSLPLYF